MILKGVRPGIPSINAPIRLRDGLVTAPFLTFANDAASGLYRIAATTTLTAQVGMAVGGKVAASFGDGSNTSAPGLWVQPAPTLLAAGNTAVFRVSGTSTFNTTAGATYIAVRIDPTILGDANITNLYGLFFQPTMNSASAITITSAWGVFANLNHGIGTLTTGIAGQFRVSESFGTLTTGIGLDVVSVNSSGTITTMIGLRMTALVGTTIWGMQVGNYSSYHHGPIAFGGTTAPTWNVHVQGGNAAINAIGIDVSTTGPTAPGSSAAGVISIYKGATNWYLLVTFNDAGTTRYRYMQLNGTTATWTHATTLPA